MKKVEEPSDGAINKEAITSQNRHILNQLEATKGTLWLFNIAMENGPFIDGFPIKKLMRDFPWLY